MSVVDKIKHYQRNIEKCDDNEDRILHCISKLSNLPVTVQHLQETGVGRTVNALRKYDGGIGDAAKALVAKWKAMVASEETSEGEEEDEACVPDAPESYSDSRESPKSEEISTRHKNEGNGKHIHRHKSEKTEASHTSHNNKYTLKHELKLKPIESQSKGNSDIAKGSSNDLEKQKKHDKSKHNHKHESRSDKKSSKDNKSASKKEEIHGSKHHSHTKSDNTEKYSSRSTDNSSISKNNEDNHKKRKTDDSNIMKKENKRRKNSESESDEGKQHTPFISEKHSNSSTLNIIKIKEEPKDKDILIKTEIKYEKKDSEEKVKASSSKHRSDSSNNKVKDTGEKHKHKSETHINHNKDETKKGDHSSKESLELKHHNNSSSDKHHDKTKDRSKKKDLNDGKNKHESKSSKDSKHSKHGSKEPKELTKIKQEINGDEGIDCHSGASFAEALGMCTIAQPSKKRINNSPNTSSAKVIKIEQSTTSSKKTTVKTESTSDTLQTLQTPSLLTSNVKLEPLSVDLASTLPEISPNYKPLPYINPIHRREEDKALTDVIYVKNQRTKVYSGNKSSYTTVPTLFEMCIRVLIENIDALEFTGGVPFDIIKPVLERATADQLFMLEHYNPYLIEDTDSLWQFHCNREFRNKQREEMETWREMYMRCLDEREAKLKTLTANIKQSIDKSVPVRSTKLAYVDNVVKPPRNVLKKQAKYGTANSVPNTASNIKKKLISGGGPTAATNISVPPPPIPRAKTSTGIVKKTKAPLMAKALQLIKGRYKR